MHPRNDMWLSNILSNISKLIQARKLSKMTPIGKVVYGYLTNDSFQWIANSDYCWIFDGKDSTSSYSSPCKLLISSGQECLKDSRAPEFSKYDKHILWPIVKRKADEYVIYKYTTLVEDMVINKLKSSR